MEHPYNIQPIGNLYRKNKRGKVSAALPTRRVDLLGVQISKLDDSLLSNNLFGFFNARDLAKISPVSTFFYVLCHNKEYWKALVLQKFGGSFTFHKSWKDTYVNMLNLHTVQDMDMSKEKKKPSFHRPIKVQTVYSDTLFRSHFCTVAPIADKWLEVENIDRVDGKKLSVEEFQKNYERPRVPVLLTNLVDKWPCYTKWNWDYLANMYSEDIHAGGYTFRMNDYILYMQESHDEQPLYIFDKKFVEKSQKDTLHNGIDRDVSFDYSVPEFFRDENDLFSVLGSERRPDYRWLIAGPARSGSSFHIDPNGTNAWNAVISGRKKWIMFPPHIVPPGVYPSNDGGDVATPVTLLEWFLNFYDYARDMGARECICNSGELIYVPQGWWHMVLNLESGIAITQNYVSQSNLRFCLDFLKNKSHLVSGVVHERRIGLYNEFTAALKKKKKSIWKEFVDSSNFNTIEKKSKITKCNKLSKILTSESVNTGISSKSKSKTADSAKLSGFSFNFF